MICAYPFSLLKLGSTSPSTPRLERDRNRIGQGTSLRTDSFQFGSLNPYVQRASYTIKERTTRGDFCTQSKSTWVPRPKTESRLKFLPSSGFSVHRFNAGDVRPRNDGQCPSRNSFCHICGVFPYSGRPSISAQGFTCIGGEFSSNRHA